MNLYSVLYLFIFLFLGDINGAIYERFGEMRHT